MDLVTRLLTLTNEKMRVGVTGRKRVFTDLEEAVRGFGPGPRFWIHNSSMGEFEQAKPIVSKLKERFPDCHVIVSFFSPSGLAHVHNYADADHLCYLPLDTRRNAARFVETIRPDAAIVIRHDFWPNHLKALNHRNVPLLLANCSIRHQTHFRWRPVLEVNRYLYGSFDEVLTISQEAADLFRHYRLGAGKVTVVGDTRYDQVVKRAQTAEASVSPLRKLKGARLGFVMGSTWPSDESVLIGALCRLKEENLLPWLVFVPHEPTEEHLSLLESELGTCGFHSQRLSKVQSSEKHGDALLVDRIGILASLYALGDLAFVGGGFGPGVHNVLEPAALGNVVLYGPRSTNSYEAGQLARRGVGFVVNNSEDVYTLLHDFLQDKSKRTTLGKHAMDLVAQNVGATDRIVSHVQAWIGSHD
jgi:3-deoxy-D-manno-octulosonic-acid transferase